MQKVEILVQLIFILFRCTVKVVKTTLQALGSIAFAFKVNTSNHKEIPATLKSYIAYFLLPKAKINVLTTDIKKKIKEIVNICKVFLLRSLELNMNYHHYVLYLSTCGTLDAISSLVAGFGVNLGSKINSQQREKRDAIKRHVL